MLTLKAVPSSMMVGSWERQMSTARSHACLCARVHTHTHTQRCHISQSHTHVSCCEFLGSDQMKICTGTLFWAHSLLRSREPCKCTCLKALRHYFSPSPINEDSVIICSLSLTLISFIFKTQIFFMKLERFLSLHCNPICKKPWQKGLFNLDLYS